MSVAWKIGTCLTSKCLLLLENVSKKILFEASQAVFWSPGGQKEEVKCVVGGAKCSIGHKIESEPLTLSFIQCPLLFPTFFWTFSRLYSFTNVSSEST